MKKLLVCLLLAMTINACKNSERTENTIQLETDSITKEEALDLLHEWTDAYLKGDANPLNEILDETWVYSGSPDGSLSNKLATIEEFSNADYKFAAITYDGLDVRIYNDIAIVTGSEVMAITGSSGTDTTKLRLRFTDVYIKKNGEIKAISTHSSPITVE